MEENLIALRGILLKAIPTVILLLILQAFLKAVLFGPMEKMLKQRDALTLGARAAADQSLAAAERKAREYEEKLRDAKAEVYKQQEETRRQWLEDQTAQIAQARQNADAAVQQARQSITVEATAARQTLTRTSESLADQIATQILSGRAG